MEDRDKKEQVSIIKLEGIQKKYQKVILKNTNLEIYKAEMIGIIGKSGVGKTTLLNIIGLIEKPDRGIIKFKNNIVNLEKENLLAELRRDKIGFVMQNYALINEKNVLYNIGLPLFCKKMRKSLIKEKCIEIAEKLEIGDLIYKFPSELSGGEAQRVAIARALVKEPEIILADEPTGALDYETETEIINIFFNLKNKGITILLVTHNMELAKKCDRLLNLDEGKIKEI